MSDGAGTRHIPVLLESVMTQLAPVEGGTFIDATFGGGGYSKALLTAGAAKVVAVDRDPAAIARATALKQEFPDRLTVVQGGFASLEELSVAAGVAAADGIVFDLGISSDQLDDSARGFSYRADGPLDMRMGESRLTAAEILNDYSERDLTDIFHRFGEEPRGRQLAKKVVNARKTSPFKTTADFLKVIEQIYPPRFGAQRRHPAGRIFQALRMAVNDEMGQLRDGLAAAMELLKPGGRLCVVTFHSLEDRQVKVQFRKAAAAPASDPFTPSRDEQAPFSLPFRRAVKPSDDEIAANPRSRSAQLRVLRRND